MSVPSMGDVISSQRTHSRQGRISKGEQVRMSCIAAAMKKTIVATTGMRCTIWIMSDHAGIRIYR